MSSTALIVFGVVCAVISIFGWAALALGARSEEPLPPPVTDDRSSITRFRRINGNC